MAMQPDNVISAGQVAGNFILPAQPEKMVFIAGGIGITPFRSMLQYIIDTGQQVDIVVFYAVSDPLEVSYQEVLGTAEAHGIRTVRILTAPNPTPGWQGYQGRIDEALITREAPDYKERLFYVSGPDAMVRGTRGLLRRMAIPRRRIKTDHFSGY
jgi:ferredoxin-NADP reductase